MGTSAFDKLWDAAPAPKPKSFDELWAQSAPDRGVFSNFARGAGQGAAESVTSWGGVAGLVPGLGGVERAAEALEQRIAAEAAPQGIAGTAGRFVGRAGGEIAQAMLLAAPLAKAFGYVAPGAAKAIQGGLASQSRMTRALATAGANAPIDIAQGLKEEEGILLPGRLGSVAENVLFSGAAGSLTRAPKVAEAVPETRPDRLLPSRAGEIPSVTQYEGPLGPAIPTAGPPRIETRPDRMLPASSQPIPVNPELYTGPAGPAIPMGGAVAAEEVGQRLADAAKLAKIPVEEPLIEVVEGGRRTRQQQTAYIRSVKKTADRLEREARRRRALPSPDMDAIAQIEAAAEAGKRLTEAGGEAGKIILPGFATYDIGGAAGQGLRMAAQDPIAGALVGGGVGAMTAEEGDTGDLIGQALAGAAVGAGVSRAAGRRLAAQRKPVPGATAPLETRTPYEQKLATGTAGRAKDAKFNRSVQLLDPTGKRLWEEEEKALAAAGMTRRRVSDADIDTFAKDIDIDDIVKRDIRKLDTVQIAALGRRISEDRSVLDDVVRKLDDSSLSDVARQQLEETREAAFERLLSYDRIYNTAAEEQGRGLRMLGRMMRQAGSRDINQAYRMAQQMMNLPNGAALSESVQQSIREVFTNPKLKTAAARDEQLAKVLGDLKQSSLLDVVLDSRAAGFLSAMHSVATNIFGSTLGATSNAIANPIAAALDNAMVASGLVKDKSVVASAGRAAAYGKAFKEALPSVADKRWYQGIDPTKPLAEMQRKKVNYINGLGLSPQEGEMAWRKTLRGGAKIFEAANNAVYGLMTATDVPFYQGALGAALKERAVMRAMRELPNQAGSPAFLKRVDELMDPMTANPVDALMATTEALDATFKTPTRMARMAREMGPLGRYLSPFTNTVTNLVRRGFEDLPVIGFAPAEMQARNIGKRLEAIGASPEEISREMRRYRTKIAGRQATTGLGAISAGYLLSKSGQLTGEYVEPMGASEEERAEIARQRLTGQAPLTLRVGDTSYSLAPFAFLIPGIVVGAALADAAKDDDFELLPAAGRATATMGRTIADLPMLQGIQNASELLTGKGKTSVKLGREAASFIPFSSALASVARATDPESAKRRPETFGEAVKERLPGLREEVAPAVGPMGEVTPGPSTLAERVNTMANPFRPAPVRTGALYEALQELEAYPTGAKRRTAGEVKESERQYAERRQLEGPAEQALLKGLLDGDPRAWAFVPAGARRRFDQAQQREQTPEGAWRELLSAALSKQRGSVTEYATQQAERQAQIEGYRPKTVPFDQRVKLILAGQP